MTLSEAYGDCIALARDHYENFPVASWLMPWRLRPHVAAVYAFARQADDIADEGDLPGDERRAALEAWRERLHACAAGESDHPVFIALGDTIRRFDIPLQLFDDLLDAFVQDTQVQSYATFDQLLDYCRRSANPVGRIVLALYGLLDERTAPPSDALCTGLQLVNFWQDVSVDRHKPRVYIPEEELARHDCTLEDVLRGEDNHRLRTVLALQVQRTHAYFEHSLPLFSLVPLRLRLELAAIRRGGMRMLDIIENQGYNTFNSRPSLTWNDKFAVFSAALLKGRPNARDRLRR